MYIYVYISRSRLFRYYLSTCYEGVSVVMLVMFTV